MMEEIEKKIQDYMIGYYKHLDKKHLRDLIIGIMSKGYYPIIRSKGTPPTIERMEGGCIQVSQPLDDELVLYTADELRDIDIDPLEYFSKILRNLEDLMKEEIIVPPKQSREEIIKMFHEGWITEEKCRGLLK